MASARPTRFDTSLIKKKEETEELLVFGYSCKLFRDDEKALYIDQGKHLIPWMGDDTLKIDRYDVRGTVYDLRPLEPLGGGASDALWSMLSDAERKVEQLCDEERYRALYHNEAEEALYQEEELKRLHKALDPQNSYGQVPFSYDNENEADVSDTPENKDANEAAEEEDEPFIPPQELDIPVGMVVPERTKLNAIIEKTAAFISTQGPQMEIILKMKQANNPQFSFLSFDCPLHAYYRHLLMAIKTGRYKTKQQRKQQEQNDSENSDHYLHPSLATATKPVELAPSIPSISYKPSADCAYSMLVNKIKDRQSKLTDESSAPGSPGDGLGRDDNSSGSDNSVIAPPPDIQVIIDKMASYVIKNGRDFESVVRSKGDDRFAFLDAGHKFHPYYEHKVRVYQGLEPPINFIPTISAPKSNPTTVTKKQTPEKKPRPILLPGYEYSDDSSESDEDESGSSQAESKGKAKLAPVSFSIKKPKEAEILKEVKSALPVEEESSEGEIDADGEASTQQSNSAPDSRSTEQEADNVDTPTSANPEEEMKRLQELLREKERQLREQEKLRKITEKQSQDIFQIEVPEAPSLPPLPPLPIVPLPPPVQDTIQKEAEIAKDSSERSNEIIKCEEKRPSEEKDSGLDGKKEAPDSTVLPLNANDILTEIAEAEVIDLTEDVEDTPKVSDTTRLERKRKAAAFLSRLQKDRPSGKNGSTHHSDSDAASRHSSPSPTRSKREKSETWMTNFHEASIPKTSLMARLAASTHMPRQTISERNKTGRERSSSHQKSKSPVKPLKDKEDKSLHRQRSKRSKDSYSSSDSEHDRSRSRSRSISYSRSPSHKRRQGDESDSEQRIYRRHKESKSTHRKKHDIIDSTDLSRHHRRYEEERRGRSFSRTHGQSRSQSRNHGRGNSNSQASVHPKRTDSHVSDDDSSD